MSVFDFHHSSWSIYEAWCRGLDLVISGLLLKRWTVRRLSGMRSTSRWQARTFAWTKFFDVFWKNSKPAQLDEPGKLFFEAKLKQYSGDLTNNNLVHLEMYETFRYFKKPFWVGETDEPYSANGNVCNILNCTIRMRRSLMTSDIVWIVKFGHVETPRRGAHTFANR